MRPNSSDQMWRREEDREVGSSEHRRTYEGGYEATRTGSSRVSGFDSRSSSSGRNSNWKAESEGVAREGSAVTVEDDRAEVSSRRRGHGGATGSRSREEKRTEWNTTWSSGGKFKPQWLQLNSLFFGAELIDFIHEIEAFCSK